MELWTAQFGRRPRRPGPGSRMLNVACGHGTALLRSLEKLWKNADRARVWTSLPGLRMTPALS